MSPDASEIAAAARPAGCRASVAIRARRPAPRVAAVLGLLALAAITGCGQKGPLRLPPAAAPATSVPVPPAAAASAPVPSPIR